MKILDSRARAGSARTAAARRGNGPASTRTAGAGPGRVATTPSDLVALQRLAGNRAVQRLLVVQRLNDGQKEKVANYRKVLRDYQDVAAVLIPREKQFNDDYFNTRVTLAPLGDTAEQLRSLLDSITETTADEAAEATLKAAWPLVRTIRQGLPGLLNAFGAEDVTLWVKQLRAERAEAAAAERRKQAKADDVKAAADRRAKEKADAEAAEAARTAELADLAITPNAAGPAFARPADAASRGRLLRWTHLTYPCFSGLTDGHLRSALCPLYHLSAAQLSAVHGYLDGRKVTAWKVSGVPATRGGSLAGTPSMLMPVAVADLNASLGGEIFCDWVVHRAGHTAAITKIIQSLNYVRTTDPFGVVKTVQANGKVRYAFNAGKYMILSGDERTLITYYDT